MPKVTGNDLVVQTLKNEGVDTVFYLTGGPMSDVAGLCLEMQFKSIDVRHEQAAAMMAHAYSRLTGKPGIQKNRTQIFGQLVSHHARAQHQYV